MFIVQLVGDGSSLSDFADAYVFSVLDHSKSVQQHTLPPGKSTKRTKKRFKLYEGTAIAEPGWKHEEERDSDGKVSRIRTRIEKGSAFPTRGMYSEMIKEAFKMMNRARYIHHRGITDREIAENLEGMVHDICDRLDIDYPATDYEVGMGNADRRSIRWSQVDRIIPAAIRFAHENYDPELYPGIQERARKAGRAYKSYNLDSHLTTAHLGVTAAARQLGISRTSVYAMRRDYADLDLSTGKCHHTATPSPQPQSAVPDRDGYPSRTEAGPAAVDVAPYVTSSGFRKDYDAHRAGEDREISRRVEHAFGHYMSQEM